jgi:hypothetical protein
MSEQSLVNIDGVMSKLKVKIARLDNEVTSNIRTLSKYDTVQQAQLDGLDDTDARSIVFGWLVEELAIKANRTWLRHRQLSAYANASCTALLSLRCSRCSSQYQSQSITIKRCIDLHCHGGGTMI